MVCYGIFWSDQLHCLDSSLNGVCLQSLFFEEGKVRGKETFLKKIIIITSNNQRLGSAGDNDRRSKRFCSNAVLCVKFTSYMVKNV